jgi:hypothetical protein
MIRRCSTAGPTQVRVTPLTSILGGVFRIDIRKNARFAQGGSGMMHRNGNGRVLIYSRTWRPIYG